MFHIDLSLNKQQYELLDRPDPIAVREWRKRVLKNWNPSPREQELGVEFRFFGLKLSEELARTTDDPYIKMLWSDYNCDGIPSINLQRVFFRRVEKADGLWVFTSSGEWEHTPVEK